jgi:uncharacterized Fe-S cluster-containing radical SAM superfamily protein
MLRPADVGGFYAPGQVAHKLVAIAEKCRFKQLRISGGEPTVGKGHLLQLLDRLNGRGLSFILETNGIPIAYEKSYAKDLSTYNFVHVRVSLKGCNGEEFSALTGAKPDGFKLQLESLEKLTQAGIRCHPSVMVSFSNQRSLQALKLKLKAISSDLAGKLEIEELVLYPHVAKRLQEYGLRYSSGYKPNELPQE